MHEHADRDHTEPPAGVTCARCGGPALGFATINGDRYCHADERSCYTEQCRENPIHARLKAGIDARRAAREDAAALTALADALDTTPAELAAGPADERLRKYAAIAVDALDLDVRRAHDRMVADDIAAKFLSLASAELHEHGRDVRETSRKVYSADIERLTGERDRAREECGHEKAMRASQREEMMRYFGDMQTAEASVDRVEALAAHLDTLAPGDRHYATRIRAALAEPEPCPHTCSCTSDQECPHDCPCDGT